MAEVIYKALAEQIREEIFQSKLAPGVMLGTELALARTRRVSRTSVRAAISSLVTDGLVERRAGKGIFVHRPPATTRVIEVIVPGLTGIWIDVVHGAQDAATERPVKVQIYNGHHDFEADLRAIKHLPKSGVDGAIIGSLHQTQMSEAILELRRQDFPFVVADQRLYEVDVPSVKFDNHQAGYLAGQELVRLGHRRIGFIGYIWPTGMSDGRLEGLRDAVNDAGLPFDRSLAMTMPIERLVDDKVRNLEDRIQELLSRPDRPTAVLFAREILAARAYKVIKAMGLRIPEDVSVIGVGVHVFGELLDPPLASVELPAAEMGRAALEILLKRLDSPQAEVEHRVLRTKWIGGPSAGKPKAES